MKKTVQVLTAIFCLLFLLAGLGRTLLSPDTEIAYENRPANRLPAFSASAFLRGEFQDGESSSSYMVFLAFRTREEFVSMTIPSCAWTIQDACRFFAGGLTCSTRQIRQAPY